MPPNKNPHDHHVHISVKPDKALYDSTAPWTIALNPSPMQIGAQPVASKPVLREGDQGADVVKLQNLLKATGVALEANGQFDAATKAAVKQFQGAKGLFVDGVVGRHTWEALEQTA